MTTFSDNFNRANGALGANYTRGRGPTDGVAISSNAAKVPNNNDDAMYIRSAETFAADQELEVTIVGGVGAQPGHVGYIEIGVRASGADATLAAYTVYCSDGSDSAIARITSGTATDLKAITLSLSASDKLKIRATGTNPVVVSVYKNSVLVDSYSDSSASRIASGKPAIGGYSNSILTTYQPVFDDATGGDVSGGTDATVTPTPAALTLNGRTPGTNSFQNVRIREVLVSASGQPVGNASNITLLVWYGGRCRGAPDVSLTGQTTDANGTTSWSIATGTLGYQDPIFYVAQDSLSFSNYTCARLIPDYE